MKLQHFLHPGKSTGQRAIRHDESGIGPTLSGMTFLELKSGPWPRTDPRRHPALGARRTARRQVRFNEMEWSLPANRGAEALREIRAFISRREFPLNDWLM
jgi:hypothetical protein